MKNYEVTFIVDPVLSSDEIKATAKAYEDHLKEEDSEIVATDEIGLKQLAYPINSRTSGVYYTIEFSNESGQLIPKMELALRRDERIMRYLTVRLDKYGVKYNEDKRAGKIPTYKEKKKREKQEERSRAKEEAKAKAKEKARKKSESSSSSSEEE